MAPRRVIGLEERLAKGDEMNCGFSNVFRARPLNEHPIRAAT